MSKLLLASGLETVSPPVNLKNFRYSFDTRLEAQKLVYLMKEIGLPLKYSFGWYVHGPYSSSLADDLYSISRIWETDVKIGHVTGYASTLTRLRNLLQDISASQKHGKDRTYWLELIASLHFLIKYSYPRLTSTREAIAELKKLKGNKFSDANARVAIRILKKNRLG